MKKKVLKRVNEKGKLLKGETDRQTDRQTDRLMEREREREQFSLFLE